MPTGMIKTFVTLDITGELLLELQEEDLTEDIGFDTEMDKDKLLDKLANLRSQVEEAHDLIDDTHNNS